MNCAKCSNPKPHWRAKIQRQPVAVKLVFVKDVSDHQQFKCPKCGALFYFLKLSALLSGTADFC